MNGRNSVSVLKSLRPLTLFDQIQELALQCNLPLPSDEDFTTNSFSYNMQSNIIDQQRMLNIFQIISKNAEKTK